MHSSTAIPGSSRLAGRLAIASGVIGFAAFACLILFLVTRPAAGEQVASRLLLGSHDVGVIAQSLCLLPFAVAFGAIAGRGSRGARRALDTAAVTGLGLIVVLMSLSLAKVVADVLYMIPQGAVGAWLLVVCRRAIGLPRGLRGLGFVAGVGLVLVCAFPVGYALFVDPAILHGPISDDDPTPPGTDRANQIVHIVLAIGTLIGCSTYPIWCALTGRWLLRAAGR